MVPTTFTEHGVVATPFAARQVAASVMPLTTTFVDVRVLMSATPAGTAIELTSIMRKRSRVTGAPVLLTNRRLIASVPFAPLVTGVRSRTRFGDKAAATFESRSNAAIVLLRTSGPARFWGPGAPRRCPATVFVAEVSAKTKSSLLLLVSIYGDGGTRPPKIAGLPFLPQPSRTKV